MTSSSRHPATLSAVVVSSRRHSAARLLATVLFITAATLLQSAAAVASASSAAELVASVGRPHAVESNDVGQQRKKEATLKDELLSADHQQQQQQQQQVGGVSNKEQLDDRSADSAAEVEIRPKRDWKSSRVQAAWGKRAAATGAAVASDDAASHEADARRRRKWNQSRQAWGKRAEDGDSELADETLEDYVDRGVGYGWNKRKWGSANVKTAWGKRKWGASNDMRVWGKRFVVADDSAQNELEDSDESIGHRFRRSVDEDAVENWAPHFQAAIRRHRSPSSSSGTRVYIGPKRNWHTNTMKVWGKRSAYDDEDVDDDGWLSANSENENLPSASDDAEEYTSWKGTGSDETRPLGAALEAWKRGWSGDNSLRVWG